MARRMPPVWFILKNGPSWPGIVTSDVPLPPEPDPPVPPPGPPPDLFVTYQGIMVATDGQPTTYPEGGYA